MDTTIQDMQRLIGVLRVQDMYKNSEARKRRKAGKIYTGKEEPEDTFFYLLDSLETAVKKVENLPSTTPIHIKMEIRKTEGVPIEIIYPKNRDIPNI